jgi:hypothetical protein
VRRLWLAGVLLSLVGCNAALDLEDAHLDPSIGASASAGSAGTGEPAAEGGEGGDGGAAPGPSLCQRYCDAVMTGCTGDRSQYTDLAACLSICPYLPEGTPGDTSGNTVSCRLTYAEKAPSEPLTYCTWAGPGGDGKCGSNCEGFCSLMTPTCTAEQTIDSGDYFATNDDCLDACSQLPDVGNYSATVSSLQSGADHVECRLYHIGAAIFAEDAATHCPHAMGRRLCLDKP